jgi:hypothetical protein
MKISPFFWSVALGDSNPGPHTIFLSTLGTGPTAHVDFIVEYQRLRSVLIEPDRTDRSGYIAIRFDSLMMPDGSSVCGGDRPSTETAEGQGGRPEHGKEHSGARGCV